MGYENALTAAGAEVIKFQYFGSYQGDWFALVHYNNQRQWAHGCYGSCSYCDAFQSEFDYGRNDGCAEHRYDVQPDCEACTKQDTEYMQRLAEFGRSYLNNSMTQAEAEKYAAQNIEWDSDAPEMLKFIQDNAIPQAPFTLTLNDRS